MSEPTATQLKDEGNELFKKQDYMGAIIKYTEAIALDDKNAVLYLDAVDDAHMVLLLSYDMYCVGLWRARGLGGKRSCLAEALDALPKTKLSPAEKKQQDQYTACLKAANARLNQPIVPLSMNENLGKFPWQIATDMLPELQKAGYDKVSSSAWVVALAYEGLTSLSNGFMRDDRVFHINQPKWIDMYNNQVYFEITARKAWNSEGLETIKEQAQKRLKESGWDDVRPALAVTVRAWIMRAAFEGGLRQKPQAGVEYYRRALDLVEWGRTIWKDAPKSSRGAIFEPSFLIGIRSLYIKMFMSAYTDDPGLNSKFPLEQLKEEAEDLLKETEIASRTRDNVPVDPGFISSFTVYPNGVAHAILGFYHVQSARYASGPLERMFSFVKAAGEYTQASNKYPEDDELRAWYLNCTMDCLRNAGAPVHNFFMVASQLRDTMPKMQKIWAISDLAMGGRDQKIQANLEKADELMKRVADKTLTLEDPVPL
ncbi:hypothetical protein BDR07DRAFT_1371671 [Suillus spraguei]|nr:hypothetical protein BDR07DRAFT_1371671 [Suillus spraguei]